MKVKVYYYKSSLEGAVSFLSRNNPFLKGESELIRQTILDALPEMAKCVVQDNYTYSTMGFTLAVNEMRSESVEDEENSVIVDILVNPGIGDATYDAEDEVVMIIDVPLESKIK